MKPVQDRGVSKDDARVPARRASRAERLIERTIFGSRWLLAPFYLGLIVGLMALLAKFAPQVADLLGHVLSGGGNEVTLGILSLIDLSLKANLVLMVVFAGYESFISRLDVGKNGSRLFCQRRGSSVEAVPVGLQPSPVNGHDVRGAAAYDGDGRKPTTATSQKARCAVPARASALIPTLIPGGPFML